jgi:tRNA threonylcarbamoyladenosine biosynthesis protein TsaE
MEVSVHSPAETEKLAQHLASKIRPGTVVALYGDLGSGKTTFTRFFAKALGSDSRVQSPTFVIARKYQVHNNANGIEIVNHLDLYRLKTSSELQELDIQHFLNAPNAITVIEWPELAQNILPQEALTIKFERTDDGDRRKIYVENSN